MAFDDNQVFLMMGVSEEAEETSVAVVMASDLESAKKEFSKKFPQSIPMTWPSLAEIKVSMQALENARAGKKFPDGFDQDVVVLTALASSSSTKKQVLL